MPVPAFDDDDDAKMSKSEKETLIEQRSELVTMLHSIRRNLLLHNQPVIEENPFAGSNHQSSELFSKKTGKFTDRGRERARCLFATFANPQGTMGYFEFRIYLENVGRSQEFHPHILANQESWCCYMYDLVGIDNRGNLNSNHFILYRETIELKYPLELDLVRIKLKVLPKRLEDWRTLTFAFTKIAKENINNNNNADDNNNKNKMNQDKHLMSIPVEEMQYLAYCSGEIISQSHCKWLHLLNSRHNLVLRDILDHYKKHNRFSKHIVFQKYNPMDNENIYYQPFSALWFSNRPKQILRTLHSKILEYRFHFIKYYRLLDEYVGIFCNKMNRLAERGYLIPMIIAREKGEQGRYAMNLQVGEQEGLDDGFSANISLTRIPNASRCFAEMGLSPGIGSVVFTDLLIRPDTPDAKINDLVVKLNMLLESNYQEEFSRHPTFHSFKVYPWTHETDDLSIIRVAFMFRPASNVDVFLKKFEIGLKFIDIIPEFSASFQLSTTLNTILESKKFTLSSDLNCIGNINTTVARRIIYKILEEILYLYETEQSESRIETRERQGGFQSALFRSKQAMFGNSKKNKSNEMNKKNDKISEISVTGFNEENRDKPDAQISQEKYDKKILNFILWSITMFFKTTKATNSEYCFNNFSEFLYGNRWVRKNMIPKWLTKDILEEPGYIAQVWKRNSEWITLNLQKHWLRVNNNIKSEQIWKEQEEKAHQDKLNKMSKKERAKYAFMLEKKALAEKLKVLGIDSGGALEVEEEAIDNVTFLRRNKAQQMNSEKLLLETYESSCGVLFGIHDITIQCGIHRLAISLQGADVFDLLPDPPPNIVK